MNSARSTLELLAAERPHQLDVVDEARRRRDLASILGTSPAGGGQGARRGRGGDRDAARLLPRRRRPALRAGLAAALVAAVVGAIAVVPQGRPDRAATRQAQLPEGPAAPGAQADPRSHAFLLASAERVLAEPAPPEGPYWYMRIRNLVVTSAEAFSRRPRGLRFEVRIESTAESWTPRHRGTGRSVDPASLGDIEISPATAEDRAAWRAAGSPRIDYPPAGVGRVQEFQNVLLQIDVPGRDPLTVDEFLRLPTEPGRLEARIRALLSLRAEARKVRKADGSVGVVTGPLRRVQVTDADVFGAAASWLAFAPLTPRLQAALYTVIAGLPAVRYEGAASDHLGRRGIAIAMVQPLPRGPGAGGQEVIEDRLIINPGTGRLLASQQVVVQPARDGARGRRHPAGMVVSAQAFLAKHWTNGPGPGGWPTNPPGVEAPKG
jgi:hypothetical protein